MSSSRLHQMNPNQAGRYTSPWSVRARVAMLMWRIVYAILFRPSPKPFEAWRLALLRLFGCQITGRPYVASSAIIRIPWLLELHDRSCIGECADIYNLDKITLKQRSVVAQHVCLCAGTHEFSDPEMPLIVGPIVIGEDAFVGTHALVLAGIEIGAGALVGAGSVVTKDVPPWMIVAGNPAKPVKPRVMKGQANQTCG